MWCPERSRPFHDGRITLFTCQVRFQPLTLAWSCWKLVEIWEFVIPRSVPNYKSVALRLIYEVWEIMQSSSGYPLTTLYFARSTIFYILYIVETWCLVLNEAQTKGYLLTNFRGSTIKNLWGLVKNLQKKSKKKCDQRHISMWSATYKNCIICQFYTSRWILGQIAP